MERRTLPSGGSYLASERSPKHGPPSLHLLSLEWFLMISAFFIKYSTRNICTISFQIILNDMNFLWQEKHLLIILKPAFLHFYFLLFISSWFFSFFHVHLFHQVLCFSTFLNLFFPHFSYFIFFTRCSMSIPSQTCLFSSFFMFIFFTRFFVSPHSQTWRSLGPLTPQQSGLSLNPTCHALGPISLILITDTMSLDSGM